MTNRDKAFDELMYDTYNCYQEQEQTISFRDLKIGSYEGTSLEKFSEMVINKLAKMYDKRMKEKSND